jgi:DNA-binding NtrC family response regulator
MLERAAILCAGGLITRQHLSLPSAPANAAMLAAARDPATREVSDMEPATTDLRTMERATIEEAPQTARFNEAKAARQLGLSRKQLYARLRQHGLE